jgi:50S ribosomal protein L16 3-hydroxylase
MTDVERHIPELNDGSVDGYVNRVNRQLVGKSFELIVHHFQAHSTELWLRMRDFFRGLYELIGIPAEKSEAVVFLRNHAQTSFGLHRDDASVFMFILEGRKKILAWPNDRFAGKGDAYCTLDYEPFLDDAIVLEGEPGDVIYWPSSHWHVGESSGAWSASISLGLRLNYQPFTDVLRNLILMVGQRLSDAPRVNTYPFDPNSLRQSATHMPGEIQTAINVLREVSLSADIEQVQQLAWLNRVTGFGFLKVPPPLPPRKLADDELIQARADYPIVWLPWSQGRIACSANGHSVTLRESPAVVTMIERLNTGTAYRVQDLIQESAGSSTVEATPLLHNVLEKLYCLRAIENCNSQ